MAGHDAAWVSRWGETPVNIQDNSRYHQVHARSLRDPEGFWGEAARDIDWIEPAKKIAVALYDESGKQVTTENYNAGEKAAVGFSPTNSGQYFVSVDLVEGAASSFCLIYSYK